jgi:hypothetical protein
MSNQSDAVRACPTCGAAVPAQARYCPTCGTRLEPWSPAAQDEFEDALSDVLNAPEEPESTSAPEGSSEPVADAPPISAPASRSDEWTASSSDWQAQPGTWTTAPQATTSARPRGNRTLWIALAVVGFLIFCCCAATFVALAVSGGDTATTGSSLAALSR